MTPSEISALMREATDKINEQNAWIEKAVQLMKESKIAIDNGFGEGSKLASALENLISRAK